MTNPNPTKRRWYHLSPDRLILGLLAVQILLLLSERFQWFAFNEKKGYTVLIAVGAVGLALVVMLLWFVASLLLRWRFQFSVRSLVLLVVAVAIPCCWLTVKMKEAERQRRAVEAIWEAGEALYDYQIDELGYYVEGQGRPTPAWAVVVFGEDFFADVVEALVHFPWRFGDGDTEHLRGLTGLEMLDLDGTQVSDNGLQHLKGLPKLEVLGLSGTKVTDAGLAHLSGLTQLQKLYLSNAQVTSQGVKELQEALPNCEIVWDDEDDQPQQQIKDP